MEHIIIYVYPIYTCMLLCIFTKCITKHINSLNLYHLVLNVEQHCGLNLS